MTKENLQDNAENPENTENEEASENTENSEDTENSENTENSEKEESSEDEKKKKNTFDHFADLSDEEEKGAKEISEKLEERNKVAIAQIGRVIKLLGEEKALEFLEETQRIEATGGMLTHDGKRRRTAGGVYLYLVRKSVPRSIAKQIWIRNRKMVRPSFEWDERLETAKRSLEKSGVISNVRVTLVGRPGKVVVKDEVVLTLVKVDKKPSLSKRLPDPPMPPPYVVYISRKQWNKITRYIKKPEDRLIVEGYPTYDKRLKAVTVYAIRTTTKLLEAERREKQRLQAKKREAQQRIRAQRRR